MSTQSLVLLAGARDCPFHNDLKQALDSSRYPVIEAFDTTTLLAAFNHNRPPALVILGPAPDSRQDELAMLKQVRRSQPTVPIILLAAHSSEEQAIAAFRARVNDYFKWPCPCTDILTSIRWLLDQSSAGVTSPPASAAANGLPALIGVSPAITRLRTYLSKVAVTDSNVLITGETGTGKELVAKRLHQQSHRRDQPLICINCAALPDSLLESEMFGYEAGAFTGANSRYEGKLRLADGGTVFFDEIGEMSLSAQAKILRAIETREIAALGGKRSLPADFRIIAATNQDLEILRLEHRFRQDLYFRLNVIRIHLPPLRERKEDIPLLFRHYVNELRNHFKPAPQGIDEQALACLYQYDWPGNARELRNLVEVLAINAQSAIVSPADLPEQLQYDDDPAIASTGERNRLLSALHATHWNKSKAAERLNWSRMTLYRKLAKYAIPAASPDEAAAVEPAPSISPPSL